MTPGLRAHDYPSTREFFSSALAWHQRFQRFTKAFEVVGLVIAIGVYLLKPNFWVFLGIVVAVILGWGVLVLLDRRILRKIAGEYQGLVQTGVILSYSEGEQQELLRLFEASKAKTP